MISLGVLSGVNRSYDQVCVAMTNYKSVESLYHEPYHTRLLIFGPKGRGFWSPVCNVGLACRRDDHRLIGICSSMEFVASTYLSVLNVVVCDYDRYQMTRALDFLPFEIQRGKPYRFQYQFLLRGKK